MEGATVEMHLEKKHDSRCKVRTGLEGKTRGYRRNDARASARRGQQGWERWIHARDPSESFLKNLVMV